MNILKDGTLNYISTYTVLHIFRQVMFLAGNQGNHQNFEKSLLSYKCWLIFIGMKQTKKKFENFFLNGWLKKTPPILNVFLWKFHGLVLGLVGKIDVEGINVAQPIWLSDCPTWAQKRAKNIKNNIFSPFLSSCRTAWQPYRLSHIDALCINLSY